MKKKLLMLGLVAACTSTMAFACPNGETCPPPSHCGHECACHKPCCPPQKCNIYEKLKLTDAQKEQAKALRMEAREQMRPLMEAIKTKQEQKAIIKNNQKLTAKAQCEQVEKLNAQINELKKQVHDLRVKNQKDFEAILTPAQKSELEKIKQEHRKNMCKGHKRGHRPQPQKARK